MHLIPISVRGSILKKSKYLPLWLLRIITNISTRPIGDEIKWIHKIEQNSWQGVWIVPDLNNLQQAEHTAVNNDLVVFYTHGNYERSFYNVFVLRSDYHENKNH